MIQVIIIYLVISICTIIGSAAYKDAFNFESSRAGSFNYDGNSDIYEKKYIHAEEQV